MQTDNPMFEELARLMSGAMGTVAGMREEAEAQMRQQFERMFRRMDMVTREEFDAVQEMAATARAEQEALAQKVAVLEDRLATLEAAKPAPRKAATAPATARSSTAKATSGAAGKATKGRGRATGKAGAAKSTAAKAGETDA